MADMRFGLKMLIYNRKSAETMMAYRSALLQLSPF